jgi:hypothetical protein
MGLAHSPRIVTDGLILYSDALNVKSYSGSGNAWSDLSSTQNRVTLVNTPTYNTTHFTFDGINDFAYSNNQYSSVTAYTIGAWFRTSVASGAKIIGFDSDQSSPTPSSYDKHIYIGTDGKVYFGNFSGGYRIAVSQNALNTNTWHYVVGTYGGEGTTARLYLNGKSESTNVSATTGTFSGWWRLAGPRIRFWPSAPSDVYYIGDIASAHVYHRSLSAEEVQQNFNALRGRYGI